MRTGLKQLGNSEVNIILLLLSLPFGFFHDGFHLTLLFLLCQAGCSPVRTCGEVGMGGENSPIPGEKKKGERGKT